MKNTDPDAHVERQIALALQSDDELWTPDCLPPDRIIALAEHTVPEAEAVSLMAHVALCARCRREYAETVDLFSLAEEVRTLEEASASRSAADSPSGSPPPEIARREARRPLAAPPFWRRWLMPGAGFASGAAAAAVLFIVVWNTSANGRNGKIAAIRNERDTQVARADRAVQQQERLAKELAALRLNQAEASQLAAEAARLKAQEKSGHMQVARLTAAEAALAQMPLPTPEWMHSQNGGQVRGTGATEGPAPEIGLIQPVGTAVENRQPVLECRPVPGATDYRFSLEAEGSNVEIAAPKRLSETRRQASAPLQPDNVYLWAVTAQRGGKQIRSQSARFYVLNAADASAISAARHKLAAQPLALGIVYARYGMRNAAAQEFRQAMKAKETEPEASRRLKEIDDRRHGQ